MLLLFSQPSSFLALNKRTNFEGLYLATLSADSSNITIQQRLAPYGGIGNNNLKPPTAGTPAVTLNSSNITAEGAASAYYTFDATVSGMTFDDTVRSIDVSYCSAGTNNWHPWVPCTYAPASGEVTGTIHGLAAGGIFGGYDVAIQPRGVNGQALGSPLLLGNSPVIHSTQISAAIQAWNEFGGTLNSDGSWSNIHGAQGHTALPFTNATVIHIDGIITAPTGGAGLIWGNTANGYYVTMQPGNVAELVKYVGGVGTALATATLTTDTNPHRYQLSITLGSSNTIEGSIDGVTLTATDSSSIPNITNPASVTVYTGNSSGSLRSFSYTAGSGHYSTLPGRVRPIILPPWESLPADGSPLAGGLLYGRHLSGAPSTDTAPIADGNGYMLHGRMSAGYQGIFDSIGNAIASSMLKKNVPNSTAWTTDITLHWSSSGTSPNITMTFWYDNGTANTAATIYNPDGTTINLGYTTSSSYWKRLTGVSTGTPVYVLLYYSGGVQGSVTLSAPSQATINAAYADGGYVAINATTTASSNITGGGSGSRNTGGGSGNGRQPL